MNTKKAFTAMLLCFAFILMSGCSWYYNMYRLSSETVVGVELIYYDNPEARTNPSVAVPLDLEKIEVLEVLDSSMIESFVDAFYLSTIEGPPDRATLFSHDGVGVRFIYEDDSFEIITLTTVELKTMTRTTEMERFFMGLYDSDGNVVRTQDMYDFLSKDSTKASDWFNDLLDENFTIRQN